MDTIDELIRQIQLRRWLKEYASGLKSGGMHDSSNQLCKDNLVKIEAGIRDYDRPLVQAYWLGYRAALTARLLPGASLRG